MIETAKIKVVQQWIENDVINPKLCPPLIGVASKFRTDTGEIDWNGLRTEVEIEDLSHFHPDDQELFERCLRKYAEFMVDSALSIENPLTKLTICPDFQSNARFNRFIDEMKMTTLNEFQTPKGQEFAKVIATQIFKARETEIPQIIAILLEGPEAIASFLVNSAYNPLEVYGRPISDQDLEGTSQSRGPKSREKVLKRGVYDMWQVIDEVKARKLLGRRNSQPTYARNTAYADRVSDYDKRIDEYVEMTK